MKPHKVRMLVFLFFLLLSVIPSAYANSDPAAVARNDAIASELNCVEQHLHQAGNIKWSDVCYTNNITFNERAQAIKQSLDEQSYLQQAQAKKQAAPKPAESIPSMESPEIEPYFNPYQVKPKEETYLFSRNNPLTDFDFGYEFYQYKYREPQHMDNEGKFHGFYGTFTYRTKENEPIKSFSDTFSENSFINMFRVDARVAFGRVDYDSVSTGGADNIPDYTWELRGLAGYDLPLSPSICLTPFMGLGYRYLNDDSAGVISTTGHYGYERESNYYYMPLGIELNTDLKPTWELNATLEYDIFLWGKQYSNLDEVSQYSYNQLINDQKEGYGIRGSMRLTHTTPSVDFYVEPFIRYWDIDDSEVSARTYAGIIDGYMLEPHNDTREFGFKLGLRY